MLGVTVRWSFQIQYAICGVFDLAYNGQGDPVQVRVIGERQGIPTRYLEQIFQKLRRAGLVTSKRGPGGGYRSDLADRFDAVLEETTLEGLCRDAARHDVPRAEADAPMYFI